MSAGFHFAAGQAKAVAWLADYLARTGVPVHLVGNEFDPNLVARPGVVVHRWPKVRGADVVGFAAIARAGRRVAARVTREHPAARVVVNSGNCLWGDLNWVHYLHTAWAPDLSAAPRWFRLKEWLVGGWYRGAERRALRAARLVLTNSRRTTADVVGILGVPADRVRTVYYGADPGWAAPTDADRQRGRNAFGLPDRPLVAFVGGFGYDNRKGFDTLLTAWKSLCGSPGWDADLVMAGGGRASAAVADRLQRDGLSGRVHLVGFTDRVFDLLAACHLLVSPVRYEPYGLNVQEAICRGLPAIVTASAGVAEEYPPDLAGMLLNDPDDADALASLLKVWRDDMSGCEVRFRPLANRLRSRTWDDMSREIVAAASGTVGHRE